MRHQGNKGIKQRCKNGYVGLFWLQTCKQSDETALFCEETGMSSRFVALENDQAALPDVCTAL